jgi:hypothetical protein
MKPASAKVGLAPGVGDQFGVEVAALLLRCPGPEGVIERDNGPAARPQGRGERPEGNAPVLDVVQGQRAGDAVKRTGFQRQRLGQVGDEEPAASGAATLSFNDHLRAQVDADDVGALVQQPLRLRSGSATGVQYHGAVQVAGHQGPERRPFQ